jgi:hypothetical protein
MLPRSPLSPNAAPIPTTRHIEQTNEIRIILLAVMIFLAGCRPSQEAPDLLGLGERFLETVSRGDSQRIAKLVVDSVIIQRALALRSREPDILRAATGRLAVVDHPRTRADTVRVFYKFPFGDHGIEELAIGFTRRGQNWLVYSLSLPDRQ